MRPAETPLPALYTALCAAGCDPALARAACEEVAAYRGSLSPARPRSWGAISVQLIVALLLLVLSLVSLWR